jgi:hypothetical protein
MEKLKIFLSNSLIIKAIVFLIQLVVKKLEGTGAKYLKPFWFSSSKNTIIAPYVYVFIGMCMFFISVGLFLYLCWIGATHKEIFNLQIILPSLAGVIATLVAMMTFMIKVYNEGKDTPSSTTPPPN